MNSGTPWIPDFYNDGGFFRCSNGLKVDGVLKTDDNGKQLIVGESDPDNMPHDVRSYMADNYPDDPFTASSSVQNSAGVTGVANGWGVYGAGSTGDAGPNATGVEGDAYCENNTKPVAGVIGAAYTTSNKANIGSTGVVGVRGNAGHYSEGGTVSMMAALHATAGLKGGVTCTVTLNTGVYVADQHGIGATNAGVYIANQGAGESDFAILSLGGRVCVDVTPVPASASAPGRKGEVAFDDNYMYRCIATNTWKRVAIATW